MNVFQPIVEKLNNFYSYTDMELSKLYPDISCKKGCTYCCFHPIYVLTIEGLVVELYLEQLPIEKLNSIKKEWREWFDKCKSLNLLFSVSACTIDEKIDRDNKYFNNNVKCPFLIKQECAIYTVRPLLCRTFVSSLPPKLCKNGAVDIRYIRFYDRKKQELSYFQALILPQASHDPTLLAGNLNDLMTQKK